jgi:hypothetical protein
LLSQLNKSVFCAGLFIKNSLHVMLMDAPGIDQTGKIS